MGRNILDAAHLCPTLGFVVKWKQLIGDPFRCPECKEVIVPKFDYAIKRPEGQTGGKERK